MDFIVLKTAVAKQFERMQKHQLFRVDVVPAETEEERANQLSMKELLWNTYLGSFPPDTNPHYRERTEHDCSCCKQFIRAIGDCVAIIDGKLVSIWDVKVPSEPGYQVVADALSALVKSHPIANTFLHYERSAGTNRNFEQLVNGQKAWEHFFVNIDSKFVMANKDIASSIAKLRDAKQVLLRALTEVDLESVETVSDIIRQNSLYRGQDYKFVVDGFLALKRQFVKLKTAEERDLFAWTKSLENAAIAWVGNSGIGVLLYDLAEGKDLEDAVKKFESSIVGAASFKRPSALVSKAMIEKAKKTIEELGLTSALQRRYATLSDISINNLLFANSSTKQVLTGDVFDEMAAATSAKVKKLDDVKEMAIADFIANVLPRAKTVEVLLENRHSGNFASLIAPVDPTAGQLFKWNNGFSWSYSGEFADSIKERVKAAGGSVTGDLCCRLAWEYKDDLDFHMYEPGGGHIYFAERRSSANGQLDVDANGGNGMMDHPVENIFYPNRDKMREGVYRLVVHNFTRRSDGAGFEVEIEFGGTTYSFGYDRALRAKESVEVAKIKYSKAHGFEIVESLKGKQSSRTIWNLPTQSFHQVNAVMLSPNYWDGVVNIPGGHGLTGIGNLHYFFMIDGCKNDGTSRGFFNEFLKDQLTPHRKVLEIVGGKMKVADSDNQLSGLGFSSTKRDDVIVRTTGSFGQVLKLKI